MSYLFAYCSGHLLCYLLYKFIQYREYYYSIKTAHLSGFAAGIIFMFLWGQYQHSLAFYLYGFLSAVLIVIACVDLKYMIIPTELTIAVLVAGVIMVSYTGNFLNGIIGFLAAGIFYLILALISRGAIGGGDVKLIAALGLFFGLWPIVYVVLLSSILGAVVGILFCFAKIKRLNEPMALGPFISSAAIIMLIL